MSHPLDRQGLRTCPSSTECLVAPIARGFHEWPPVRAALLVAFASLLILATAAPSLAQVLGASQLAIGRRGHTATLLNNGRILVVGGENAAGAAAQSELIDPSSGAVTHNNLNSHIVNGEGDATLSRAFPQDLAFTHDGSTLYAVAQGSQKLVWYPASALEAGTAAPSASN